MKIENLNPQDLSNVVGRLPKDVRAMLRDDPTLSVAGGFIRAVIAREAPSDIDVFGPTKLGLEMTAAVPLAKRWGARVITTKNAITVLGTGHIAVQFITRWLFPDDAARMGLLASFDFTVAQAAVWWDGKAWRSACGERFYWDLAAKRLTYLAPMRDEDAGGSMMRLRKFLSRGYWILAPDLAGVVTRLVSGVDAGKADKSKATMTAVLTGLLREVDPLLRIGDLEVAHDCAEDARLVEEA